MLSMRKMTNNNDNRRHVYGAYSGPAAVATNPWSNGRLHWIIQSLKDLSVMLVPRLGSWKFIIECPKVASPDSISKGVFPGYYGIKQQKVSGICTFSSQKSNENASPFRARYESWVHRTLCLSPVERTGMSCDGWYTLASWLSGENPHPCREQWYWAKEYTEVIITGNGR